MIYLNSNIINKIGNSNRLYYNGSIVYQGYISKPLVPYENWTVIGDINGEYWVEDVPMYQDYDNPYIYKSEPITFNYEIGQFKIRLDGGWYYQYGSDSADVHNVGEVFDVWKNNNSSNIKIYNVPNTPYTIYLDTSNHSMWVEGEIPTAPPAPVVNTWGVVGDLTVGLWNKDIPMELEDDLYVARNVVFADAEGNGCVFKIRQNGNWDVNFGSYGSYWFLYEEIPLYGYGSNIVVADGIVGEPYTIYFNPTSEMLWVEGDSKEPEGYEFRGRAEAKIYSNHINLNFYDDEKQNELSISLNTTNTDYIELGEWTTTIGDNYIQNIIFNGQTVGLKDIYFYVDEYDGDYYIDIDNSIQHFNFIGKIDGIMTPSQANQPDEPETPEIPEGMVSLQYCWDNSIFNIPFRECYIDMNNVEDDASSYYFIALATKPNTQNASITSYSICPKENTIFDKIGSYSTRYGIMENFYNGSYNFMEVVAIPLGDGIYYYQFAQPVYLSNKPSEANAPYWRVNVVPINN